MELAWGEWTDELVCNNRLAPDIEIDIECGREIVQLIREGDLQREEAVGHVFGHFRLTRHHPPLVGRFRHERHDRFSKVAALRRVTNELPVRLYEIDSRLCFAQEFRVKEESVLREARLKGLCCAR